VKVDLVASLSNPPKKDKAFGVPGWFVGTQTRTNAIGIAPEGGNEVRVRSSATANTKWAPAKAYATAYGQNGGTGNVFVLANARATGKPSLATSAISSNADGTAIAGGQGVGDAGAAVVLSSSRATGGQGQTIAGARGYAESANTAVVSIDSRANSAKWYMAPGNSVAGGEALGRGGHVNLYSDVRARADLGTATSGVLNIAKSNGAQPVWFELLPTGSGTNGGASNIIYSMTNNDPRADAGAAIAGTINIGSSAKRKLLQNTKVVLLNDNVEASTAVGEAAAGLLNVGVSNTNNVLIGDYDTSDATQNEVISKVRGRGEAQGGMVNIGE